MENSTPQKRPATHPEESEPKTVIIRGKVKRIRKCCLCGGRIEPERDRNGNIFYIGGRNPWPLKDRGECCEKCDNEKVLPERFFNLYKVLNPNTDIDTLRFFAELRARETLEALRQYKAEHSRKEQDASSQS